ncbi:carboxypeptidase-like regulatory domain-containing protein [Pseudactinotalea suaedae]|uniref:carboxypeptidase-like regulatory domain-containing protein n=1 Tax=Pseudactinotalea suaedae TaxID=1524924 RepID=UPI0012E27EF7|nr:carboxypeptidase-like regulatory domain-containing protein [Pseudactinotalea suaedae]
MRVASTVERAEIAPGESGTIPLDVVNTSAVIDALSVRVLGFPASATVRSQPEHLTLFPQSEGALEVHIGLPATFPAGTYHVTLVVEGRAAGATDAYHDLEVVVPPQPAVSASATPSVVRARGRALFTVTVANEGNTPLDLALRVVDTDRSLRTTLTPSTLSVPIGRTAVTTVSARGPRQLLGADRDRPLRVVAEAEGAAAEVALTLKQRSTFGRGLITALILLVILAAWAVAVTVGMRAVLGADPGTKVAPPSFFAATEVPGEAAGAAPAGALPRDGLLPAGVGATITGTVQGAEDPVGVGRLTVEALRTSADGLVLVSSAATQADGTYSLAGLFPGEYLLRVAADGYETVWYPGAADSAGATGVQASAQQVTTDIDLVVAGDLATITGMVHAGGEDDVVVTVTAVPVWLAGDDAAAAPMQVQAAADGSYALPGLVAPGRYDLTFEAPGYQPTTITEQVLGGQQRLALDITLGAGLGQIEGTVTDGFAALGGVEVSTTLDGEEIVVGTPTQGRVGTFVIPSLPTPATYVLTASKEGYGTQTVVVALAAGESKSDVTLLLTGGVGTISGHVVGTDGQGVGGVTVVAGGTSEGVSATSLTAGDVGAFTLTGVQGSATVTLTFTKEGYAPASVPVSLAEGPPGDIRVTLSTMLGAVQGRVTDGGQGVTGVRVEATDGSTVHSTVSTATGSEGSGSYLIPDLRPGTYAVTVVSSGRVVTTAIVTVLQGSTAQVDLPFPSGG